MNEHDKNLVKDNFIGWISDDGLLEVVGIADEVGKYGRKLYKVICRVCSPDTELFPEGYFVTRKGCLLDGNKPCGCSTCRWEDWQFLVLARRVGEGRFIVHGFAEEFKNQNTKLDCECLKDGHKWTPKLKQIVYMGQGCPKCHGNAKLTEPEALGNCTTICKEMGYEVIGFDCGYKNNKSRFKYTCPKHGAQEVSYNDFVIKGTRCPLCADYGYNINKQGSFYVAVWKNDSESFIKFGKTNRDVVVRIEEQNRATSYSYSILYQQTWLDGRVADSLEKSIKDSDMFKVGIVSKILFPFGFTETIKTSEVDSLMLHINNFLINYKHEVN